MGLFSDLTGSSFGALRDNIQQGFRGGSFSEGGRAAIDAFDPQISTERAINNTSNTLGGGDIFSSQYMGDQANLSNTLGQLWTANWAGGQLGDMFGGSDAVAETGAGSGAGAGAGGNIMGTSSSGSMWPSIIQGAGSIIGGYLDYRGNQQATDAQIQANREALAQQMAMYQQNRADMMPWLTAGKGALSELNALYGLDGNTKGALKKLQNSPGYKFRKSEYDKAIEARQRATGGYAGGRALKELARYSQDYASNEYTNRANQLSSLAGLGQSQSQSLGALGANSAAQQGNYTTDIGNATSAGATQRGRILGNTVQGLGNLLADYYARSYGY